MDPNQLHITLGGVLQVIDKSLLQHHNTTITQNIRRILDLDLSNIFTQRFEEHHVNRHDHQMQDFGVSVDGRAKMDRVILDPVSKMVSFSEDTDTGIPGLLRAAVPLSFDTTSYFEIEIVSLGESGSVGMGLVPPDFPFGNQPGLMPGSIGYHSADGGVFIQSGFPNKVKDQCVVGDRMGCGIEMISGQQFVYFTKNGLTVAEQPFGFEVPLFPAVGLNSPGVRVRLIDAQVWGLDTGGTLDQGWNDQIDDGIDVTIIGQTGHISVFWKNDGFRDVLIPATVQFSREKAYFEIELFAIGEGDDISVGFVPKNYPQGRHPGWLPNSVGFHIAKGQFFAGQPFATKERVNTFAVGDKIGCGLEYIGNTVQIYFNKNGAGFLEEEITLPGAVFPAVGLRSAGKTVSICVQEFETWGFEANKFAPIQNRAKLSAIKCDVDSCTASLKSVPGQTVIATLIANQPFSRNLSHFDFEFLEGESVVAGVVSQGYDVDELPGCHPKSLGYHSDDGGIYEDCGRTSVFMDACSHGDRMGCSLDFSNEQPIFCFTRNGQTIAEVPFGNCHQKWFPAIGMKSERTNASVLISDLNMDIWKESAVPDRIPQAEAAARRDPHQPVDQLEAFGQELNCPICWSILENPKIFPCRQQHSFCLDCLRNLCAGVGPGAVVQCPVCRFGANAPRRVEDLPDNAVLNRLVEVYKTLTKK